MRTPGHVPVALATCVLGVLAGSSHDARQSPQLTPDYPVRPVPFTAVHLTDDFWAPRIETNRGVTIPFAFEQCENTGRIGNFVRAAAKLSGETLEDDGPPGYPFDDTDPYKVIEGASYTLAVQPDARLEAYLDELIAKIAAAQEPDGYLYTTRTINPEHPHRWAGSERWVLVKDDSHELYNLGHLFEAAVAHYRATGKRNLLDVAIRSADLLTNTFGPDKEVIWPGHQITEMGLVKLYRVTGERKYLELAQFMLEARGPDGDPGAGREYNQSHRPVVEQEEAVGHAVRATYMYAGMADVAALTGDEDLLRASERLWENVVGQKLYITGGIGATGRGEAFGDPYVLPNMTAYAETCAAVGNDYWNHRLFLLTGDARYLDVMERTLYNGLVSGVSLDGKTFFYPNPLESAGQHERKPWFGVACCPGNITRVLASVPGYVYAVQEQMLFVNLYAAGTAEVDVPALGRVRLAQDTQYPWDGTIRLTLTPEQTARFTVKLRVPGWAREQPVPSDLYRFLSPAEAPVTLAVNGHTRDAVVEKGFATVTREWAPGDVVELSLPMPVRRVVADERVAADRDRVALQRGPIVYAAEWPDNRGGHVRNLVLPDDSPLGSTFRPSLLGGVPVVTGDAIGLAFDEGGDVARTSQTLTAIPYATWANRGRGEMIVWLARSESVARPTPRPTIATTSTVTSSGTRDTWSINDGEQPESSADQTAYFHWAPRKGTTEWIEYSFSQPETISESEVYWFHDTLHGEIRVPARWRLLYRDDGDWRPVEARAAYDVELDRFNRVTFEPVTTDRLRLEVQAQPEYSIGVHEWRVR